MVTTENLYSVSGIYCAVHRETLMCYIGSSANIGKRIPVHLSSAKRGDRTCFYRALKDLKPESFDFELIEKCEKNNLHDRERFWIAFYGSASIHGFNTIANPSPVVTGVTPSKLTRERRRLAMLGHPTSEETRMKIRIKHLGMKHTPESRAKMSASHLGVPTGPHSPETRRKISISNTGKTHTEESNARNRAWHTGRTLSEAHKMKIANASRGKKHTPEAKLKISIARLGIAAKKKLASQSQLECSLTA